MARHDRYALPYAATLARILKEAEDIASATGQRLGSAHALLAFFTTRNHAERLLRDRSIDEDRLLELFDAHLKEPPDALIEILERAAQVAAGCGAREIDSLHVLVAMTRARESMAFRLLEATGEKLGLLRTRALTILTGAVPRWLAQRGGTHERRTADVNISGRPSRNRVTKSRVGLEADRPPTMTWTPPVVTGSKPGRRPSSSSTARRPPPIRDRHPPQEPASKIKAPPPTAEEPAAPPPALPPIEPKKKDAEDKLPALTLVDKDQNSPSPASESPTSATPWLLPAETYPWLTSLGRNLTAEAAQNPLDHLVGRQKEVETLIDILGKRRSNNPCLIGEPGVGKTAVVEGLAAKLLKSPAPFRQKILVSLDVGALLVGTHLRGSFSEKLRGIQEEVKQSDGRIIVFFDELHTLVGAGSTGDGPQDAAQELKAALARGDFPCIGATTFDEYVEHIEKDPALKRRFVPVLIKEPSPEQAVDMLRQIMPAYADHHDIGYQDHAIVAAVELSTRYLTEGHLPDKAIALLDLAGSRASRSAIDTVDRQQIANLVAERTDLPIERLLDTDHERLLNLEAHLKREIVGHESELEKISKVIRRNAAGFRSHRPQGSFLFLGPTGVGKTETAKALARTLHGTHESMIRLDLSEFAESHSVARLVGSPPGYVGHDAGGQLTEAVRKHPGRIVLFDELEKAHQDVLQILLQILDEGCLTDSKGRSVSFAETIIILTSNLGANLARNKARIGFGSSPNEAKERDALRTRILERAQPHLPPELWGRIEEKLVFAPLSRPEVRKVAQLLAEDSSRRLMRERGISYEIDASALDFILNQGGFDVHLGARPMRHVLSRIVEAPIAARILEGRLHAGEHVCVSTRENGTLIFLVDNDSLSQRPRR